MSKIDDGGPAFPRPISTDDHSGPCSVAGSQDGMTLRDWLAGQALPGVLTAEGAQFFGRPEMIAGIAYEMADAMLVARVAQGGAQS